MDEDEDWYPEEAEQEYEDSLRMERLGYLTRYDFDEDESDWEDTYMD